jgi:splicing factor 3B subunit 2
MFVCEYVEQKLSVAELKQLVSKPEVVEWVDCDARDPRLLVSLKAYRKSVLLLVTQSPVRPSAVTDFLVFDSTVPVPVHWSAKREYLSGKRGIEKAPFQLPRE